MTPQPQPTPLPVNQVLLGDCIAQMNALPEKCADLIFADPPYNMQLQGDLWRPNMTRVDAVNDPWDKFNSFAEYDAFTRAWLLAARRVLKDTGTIWVMGSYHCIYRIGSVLQDLGYWILNDIAWVKCLSETTCVYALGPDGDARPVAIKDLIRGDVEKHSLWNGSSWSRICGWRPSQTTDGLEIYLRSGEKLRCTREHRWPTERGLVTASDLVVGDVLERTQLPESPHAAQIQIDDELSGWFVGLYIAEGSRHQGTISIASQVKEKDRFQRLREVAAAFHGQCRWYELAGQAATVTMHGPILNGLVDTYVAGKTPQTKHLSAQCWGRSNTFLRAVLAGYLEGDGHYDTVNDRWRLDFAQNRYLEVSLRTLAARLNTQIRIKDARGRYNHQDYPLLRGEIRWVKTNSPWSRQDTEVVSIKPTASTHFVDLSVEDEPHLFALASGVLTHNSNPTPQMKGTRFCNAHDTLIWAQKSAHQAKYTFHYKALKAGNDDKQMRSDWHFPVCNGRERETVNGKKAHTTQKPESLLHRVIAATSNPGDLVLDPFCGCYDEETEVLTRNGWKFWRDVAPADEFITYRADGALEYHPPTQMHRYHFQGRMVSLRSRSTDLLVTPNHNMLVKTHADFSAGRPARFVRADCLNMGLYRVPCGGHYTPECHDLSKAQMALIGLYVSEGYFKAGRPGRPTGDRLIICQKRGPKWDKMMEMLADFQPVPLAGGGGRKFSMMLTPEFAQFIKSNCGESKYHKFLSATILKNTHQDTLYAAMMLGDGYSATDSPLERYYTSSRGLADAFQELCLKIGYDSTLVVRSEKMAELEGRLLAPTCPQYQITVRKSQHKKLLPALHLTRTEYDGEVYCVTVPNNTLYVRRNGKTSWCGNTGTTAAVAKKLGRNYLTIDREPQYVNVAEKRLKAVSPSLLGDAGVFVDAPKPRIPFVSLVEGGKLQVGGRLRLKGAQTTAVIHADGSVTAAGHRGSIHKVAAHCLGLPSANGWTCWYYVPPDTGEETLLDTYR